MSSLQTVDLDKGMELGCCNVLDIRVAHRSVEPVLGGLVVGEQDLLTDVTESSKAVVEQLATHALTLPVRTDQYVLEIEHRYIVGQEPYKGSDAYVSDGRFMAAMVSTFDGDDLKRK